jgi:hypothetical protein
VTANPGGGEGGEWAVSWTNQVNGLAHDSKNWYWIREKKIHVIPLNEDMTHFGDYIADWASYTDASTYLTGGWNVPGNYVGDFHFGDGDFYQGHLFVPIETTVDQDWGQFVAIYNPVASYRVYSLGTAVPTQLMPLQMHFAWLAINPQDGIVFTATTFSGVSSLQTYKIESNLTLTPLGSVPLKWADGQPLTLANEVQGGAFSPNGHLYISVGTHDDLHGVYAVDTDGTLHGRTTAWWDHGPSLGFLFSPDGSEEVEGMDILDMSAYPASGMVGQIHMIKMNLYNWPKNDGLIFHHWKINSPYY